MNNKCKKMSKEDKLHQEIRDWIDLHNFTPMSLDDLIYEDMFGVPFMTPGQREEANQFIKRFNEL